jgi:hypothetical protein
MDHSEEYYKMKYLKYKAKYELLKGGVKEEKSSILPSFGFGSKPDNKKTETKSLMPSMPSLSFGSKPDEKKTEEQKPFSFSDKLASFQEGQRKRDEENKINKEREEKERSEKRKIFKTNLINLSIKNQIKNSPILSDDHFKNLTYSGLKKLIDEKLYLTTKEREEMLTEGKQCLDSIISDSVYPECKN